MLQTLNHSRSPSLDLLQEFHVSFVQRPQLDTVQVRLHQGWAEREDHLPEPAGNALPKSAQDTICIHGYRGTLLAHGQLVHHDSQVPLHRAIFPHSAPSLYWCTGLLLPRCRILHLSLLNFKRFLFTLVFSLSRSFWITAQHSTMEYQTLLPLLYHQQTCWRGTLSHHASHL